MGVPSLDEIANKSGCPVACFRFGTATFAFLGFGRLSPGLRFSGSFEVCAPVHGLANHELEAEKSAHDITAAVSK